MTKPEYEKLKKEWEREVWPHEDELQDACYRSLVIGWGLAKGLSVDDAVTLDDMLFSDSLS